MIRARAGPGENGLGQRWWAVSGDAARYAFHCSYTAGGFVYEELAAGAGA